VGVDDRARLGPGLVDLDVHEHLGGGAQPRVVLDDLRVEVHDDDVARAHLLAVEARGRHDEQPALRIADGEVSGLVLAQAVALGALGDGAQVLLEGFQHDVLL
jgi:hypothetical protein